MTSTRTRPDPLRPIEMVISFAMTMLVVWWMATAALAFAGSGASLGAWGQEMPCLEVPQTGIVIGSDSQPGSSAGHGTTVNNLRPGVVVGTLERYQLCKEGMGAVDRALISIPVVLDLLWTFGFLALTSRVIRRARRGGLFTEGLARPLQQLGRYILWGWVLVAATTAAMHGIATSHLVTDYGLLMGTIAQVPWSWPIVIGGFATLTVGRILRETVPLREEVEATV